MRDQQSTRSAAEPGTGPPLGTTREQTALSAGRRHDLDALRAFAMLLGVALHAALSFTGKPWIVVDSHSDESLAFFGQAVHGFRMQLFFLVSGFFAALVCNRRGMKAMLKNRLARILVPCLLALVTIQPLMILVAMRANTPPDGQAGDTPLIRTIRANDAESVDRMLGAGALVEKADPQHGVKPLSWAVLAGQTDIVRILLAKGGNFETENRDGARPLHAAAFMGRPEAAKLLLDRGADPKAKTNSGDTVMDVSFADADTTQGIAQAIGIPIDDWDQLEEGRKAVRELIAGELGLEQQENDEAWNLLGSYQALLSSDQWRVGPFHLIYTGIFGHLWFLWFLCWLVALQALIMTIGARMDWGAVGSKPPLWAGLALAVVLSALFQAFMGISTPGFGPDTATGILPPPHLLAYYAVFYLFGAYYFSFDSRHDSLGYLWWLWLPLALGILLPAGLAWREDRLLSVLLQTGYAWLMTLGMIGVFHRFLNWQNQTIRYCADSAYWLYLAHLPLVVWTQGLVRDWPMPALVKFSLVTAGCMVLLVASYQLLVRHTWLGKLLNGPRKIL